MKSNKQYWIAGGIIIVIIILVFATRKPAEQTKTDNNQSQMSTENKSGGTEEKKMEEKKSTSTMESGKMVFEGTLQVSDNPSLGNLKLVTSEKSIYLRTSRDFSGLIGKKVTVTTEGTSKKFTLVDITEKK